MTGVGRPLKFLVIVLLGWSGARAALLWPGAPLAVPAEATASAGPEIPVPAAAFSAFAQPLPPPTEAAAAAMTPLGAPMPPLLPFELTDTGFGESAAPAPFPEPSMPLAARMQEAVPPAAPASVPVEPALALVAQPPGPSRWSASAWLVARAGSMAGNGAFGPAQLGGSQAGARIRYALGRTLALSGRLSAPLRGIGREAGLGVEWQPLKIPLSILLERRVALDAGRGGTALGAITGINPTRVAGRLELEGYGQAGVVARRRREPYADGALRLLQPVASGRLGRLAVGAGVWGGAQRGASRLDVGPSLVATVPTAGPTLRVAAEWRQRVAGNAAPGSGPALTLGTDF